MKKKDFILSAVLIIIAFVAFFMIKFLGNDNGKTVVVKIDGKEYGSYPIDKENEIEINTDVGKNVIIIKDRQVYMNEADCPDGYCKRQGKISKENQTIVCLPHKLVVEIRK